VHHSPMGSEFVENVFCALSLISPARRKMFVRALWSPFMSTATRENYGVLLHSASYDCIDLPLMNAPSIPASQSLLGFEHTRSRSQGPQLECGFAAGLNDHVEAAHEHSLRWAVAMGLIHGEGPKFERFRAARFAWLAGRAYPRVGARELNLISDWITFLFFYDDMCDTQAATDPRYLDKLVAAENRLLEIAQGSAAREGDSPLERALADIRARAAELASEAWLTRLAAHIREYVDGCRWERIIRLQGQVPSLATYSRLRLLISAVFPCFDFAGMCLDGTRTDFADNVLVQQLEIMANNYVCWVNDIHGVDKELDENTTSNLVIVLVHEFDLDWNTALDRAIEMCNAELEAFATLARQITELADTDCRDYIEALEAWMRGNLDWYAETHRYRTATDDTKSCWSTWTRWESVA
jgi:5-epi-alpha-selinene synthase